MYLDGVEILHSYLYRYIHTVCKLCIGLSLGNVRTCKCFSRLSLPCCHAGKCASRGILYKCACVHTSTIVCDWCTNIVFIVHVSIKFHHLHIWHKGNEGFLNEVDHGATLAQPYAMVRRLPKGIVYECLGYPSGCGFDDDCVTIIPFSIWISQTM